MRINELLDETRNAVPDCHLAAYIDLDAELVLAASAAGPTRQETLDALAAQAGKMLRRSDAQVSVSGQDDRALRQALCWTPSDTLAFVRSASDPAEVICCKCAGTADLKAVLASAEVALNWIGTAP